MNGLSTFLVYSETPPYCSLYSSMFVAREAAECMVLLTSPVYCKQGTVIHTVVFSLCKVIATKRRRMSLCLCVCQRLILVTLSLNYIL